MCSLEGEGAKEQEATARTAGVVDDPSLPDGWVAQYDPTQDANYYFNESTGETTWKHPGPQGDSSDAEEDAEEDGSNAGARPHPNQGDSYTEESTSESSSEEESSEESSSEEDSEMELSVSGSDSD